MSKCRTVELSKYEERNCSLEKKKTPLANEIRDTLTRPHALACIVGALSEREPRGGGRDRLGPSRTSYYLGPYLYLYSEQ